MSDKDVLDIRRKRSEETRGRIEGIRRGWKRSESGRKRRSRKREDKKCFPSVSACSMDCFGGI